MKISTRFGPSSTDMHDTPVTFPPGRASDLTNPIARGSHDSITIGMMLVSAIAATTASSPLATITSTPLRTISAAKDRISSCRPAAKLYSILMFLPSTKPSFSKSSRNSLGGANRPRSKKPILGIFVWALATRIGAMVTKLVRKKVQIRSTVLLELPRTLARAGGWRN